MEKKSAKKYIFSVLAVLLAAALVIIPFALESAKDASGDKASILSAEAALADISKTVSGAGTLTDEDAVEIKLPYGVEVTKYLVNNGDFVTEGQPLAEVDRIDVMNSIYEYQEDLEYVETQMALYTDTGEINFLTTASAGRVMELYADAGDSISDVMLEHGALAVLSLDGLLAVDIETDAIPVGSSVGVAAPDGTILSGHAESKKNGVTVITINQDGRAVGESVSVFNENSETIGSGELYVHSPLKISGYNGTIEAVHVKINQDMQAGGTVFTYSGNSSSAEYGVYAAKHTELAGYMEELFRMYTDGTVNASSAGVVSGIDEDAAAELLAASGEGNAVLDLLTNVATLENGGTDHVVSDTAAEGYPYVYYEAGKVNYMVTNYDAAVNPGNSWINILRTDNRYSERLTAINAVADASWQDNLSFEQLNNYGVDTSQISESNVGQIIFVFEYYCASPDTYTLNSVSTEISGVTVWASTTAEKSEEKAVPASFVDRGNAAVLKQVNDFPAAMPGIYYSAGVITAVNLDNNGEIVSVAYRETRGDRYEVSRQALDAVINGADCDEGKILPVPSYGLNAGNAKEGALLLFTYSVQSQSTYDEALSVSVVDENGTIISGGSSAGSGSAGGGTVPGDASMSGGQMTGGGSASGMTGSTVVQAAYEYYPTKQTKIMSVTPQDTMTVDITVDELDILSIKKGQDVQITLDALAGQSFDGIITDIGVSGSNSGGNTKYTAEVTIDRAPNMIAGMNATALITLETDENLLTVPSEALVSEGTRTYVYTSYDSKTGALGNPVDVTTGASDGILTEITSGLKAGDTVWYSYYDKLDNDFSFSADMPQPPDMN